MSDSARWRPGLTSHRTVATFRGHWLRTFDGSWWVLRAGNRQVASGRMPDALNDREAAQQAAEDWVRARTEVREEMP